MIGVTDVLVGYMRVSSDGDRQTTALQRDALLAAGVDDRHLYEDKASGARALEEWGRMVKSLYLLAYIDDEAALT